MKMGNKKPYCICGHPAFNHCHILAGGKSISAEDGVECVNGHRCFDHYKNGKPCKCRGFHQRLDPPETAQKPTPRPKAGRKTLKGQKTRS